MASVQIFPTTVENPVDPVCLWGRPYDEILHRPIEKVGVQKKHSVLRIGDSKLHPPPSLLRGVELLVPRSEGAASMCWPPAIAGLLVG